jgi:hypothetical protein
MRSWFSGLMAGAVAVVLSLSAHAQATKGPAPQPSPAPAQGVTLPDGKYASLPAYLAGTWKWERQEPRQSMIMRFGPGNAFFFHNFTIDLQHWGTFSVTADTLTVFLTRSCSEKSTNCGDRSPPDKMEFGFQADSANVFQSSGERWERMK